MLVNASKCAIGLVFFFFFLLKNLFVYLLKINVCTIVERERERFKKIYIHK